MDGKPGTLSFIVIILTGVRFPSREYFSLLCYIRLFSYFEI